MCTIVWLMVLLLVLNGTHAWEHRKSHQRLHPAKGVDHLATLEGCRHQICDHVDPYPEDEIEDVMQREHKLRSLLEGTVFNTSAESSIVLESRDFFDEYTTVQFCRVEGATNHAPRALRNVYNQWKYVVNTRSYKQRISVEACRALGDPYEGQGKDYCSDIGMACVQNFQNLSLLTYDSGTVKFDVFTLPTNCQCSGC